MTRAVRLLLLALGVTVALACEVTRHRAEFPHLRHLENESCGGPGQPPCLNCASCHAGVRDETKSKTPGVAQCKDCHDDAAAQLERFTKVPPAEPALGKAIVFSHSTHLDKPEIAGQCVKCHAGVVSEEAGAERYPPMSTCLNCHQSEFDQGRCTPCHAQRDLARLMPQSFMRHDAGWMRGHGQAAIRQQVVCNQCHTESTCNDCHDLKQTITLEKRMPERIGKELVHRGDFLTRHAIEAAASPAKCLTCHTPSTCNGCHVERGVSAARVGSANPHPLGWVGPDTDSRNFHGRAARRDILSCASCHDQGPATNCIRCHKVGGGAGNPHPSGWTSSRTPTSAMCRYCHVP